MKEKIKRSSGRKKLFFLLIIIVFIFSFSVIGLHAQDGNRLSLAITPPLFQVSIEPGGSWTSSVKMINGEGSDIEVYATPVNFQARGEDGSARFIPIVEGGTDGVMSAEWINISKGPYKVPAEGSIDIPFTVSVPEDATPGGHYAALLIGTNPVDEQAEGSVVRVSSLVTALFLMRIEGDVIESGHIREFRTDTGWYNRPEARFVVSFQNTGTVHLQPRGVIEIYNMWGNQRGSIPINTRGQFGNVLHGSSGTFSFRWEGDSSIFEAGRYTANITLAYGTDSSRHVSETLSFWVLPIVPFLTFLAILLVLIVTISGAIRLYIRRVLAYEKVRLGSEFRQRPKKVSLKSLRAPIRDSVIDMKRDLKRESRKGFFETLKHFIVSYRTLVIFLLAILFLAVAGYLSVSAGLSQEFKFRIFEERPAGESEIVH